MSSEVRRLGSAVGSPQAVYRGDYRMSVSQQEVIIRLLITDFEQLIFGPIDNLGRFRIIDAVLIWSDPNNRPILLM